MRISHAFTILVITSCTAHGLAQEGVNVRVGRDIGVDTRGDGVRIQVGPLRIRVGGRTVRRSANVPNRAPQRVISRFLSDRTLIEAPVFNRLDRRLGQVKDIVIDTRNGQVRYAAISYHDIDEGKILFAVPLNVFQLKWHPRGLVWRTDFEDLALWKAPGFDAGQWPDSADHHWIEEIDAYYSVVTRKGDLAKDFGSDPQTVKDEPQLERTSRLLGLPLLDASTNALGTVRRLIFDRDAERIRYIVIQDHEPDGNSSRPDAILVPIEAVTCTTIADTVQLTTQLAAVQFMNAPRVRLARALQPGHEDWTAGVDAWFNVTSPKSTDQAVDR